jgi:DNA-binding protein H-NS
MAKAVDLSALTLKELHELQAQIGPAIAERTKAERADIKAKLAKIAADAGFDLEDVVGTRGGKGKGSRSAVAVKYRNPEDPSRTWTGRGRKPNWLTEKMAKRGAKIEDFAV